MKRSMGLGDSLRDLELVDLTCRLENAGLILTSRDEGIVLRKHKRKIKATITHTLATSTM